MEITEYLRLHLARHPSMHAEDVVKLCYQAAFGAEHLLADPEAARVYLERECADIPACDGPLCEHLSDEVCRVSLAAWKAAGLPLSLLFRLFTDSAVVSADGEAKFRSYLTKAGDMILAGGTSISPQAWTEYIQAYESSGTHAVHHSPEYRTAEKPAYRIVRRSYLAEIPELCKEKPQ